MISSILVVRNKKCKKETSTSMVEILEEMISANKEKDCQIEEVSFPLNRLKAMPILGVEIIENLKAMSRERTYYLSLEKENITFRSRQKEKAISLKEENIEELVISIYDKDRKKLAEQIAALFEQQQKAVLNLRAPQARKEQQSYEEL